MKIWKGLRTYNHHPQYYKLSVLFTLFISITANIITEGKPLSDNKEYPNHLNSYSPLTSRLNSFVSQDDKRVVTKRASSSSRKLNNNPMSFGQLLIFAREEAKCLLRFGGQKQVPVGTTSHLNKGFYFPFSCTKNGSLEQFAQCEQCRNITNEIRTPDECENFCGKEESCVQLCISINKAVSDGSEKLEFLAQRNTISTQSQTFLNLSLHNIQGELNSTEEQDEYTEFWTKYRKKIFPNDPQVFCEGVVNKSENGISLKQPTLKGLSVEETLNSIDKKNHFVVLKWSLQNDDTSLKKQNDSIVPTLKNTPIIYVIEKFSRNSSKWETVGKTRFSMQMLSVAFWSDIYKWRVTAVGTEGVLDQASSSEYTTLNGYHKPGPPKKIYVVETAVNNFLVNVLIGWDAPKERACFYKIVLETHEGPEKFIRIKEEPLGVHRYWFDNLRFGLQYSVLITSRDPTWDQNSESNLTRFDFTTPTCLESYNYRFDKCAPSSPRDIQSKILGSNDNGKSVGVLLSWKPPQNASNNNPVLKYKVTLSRLNFRSNSGSSSNKPFNLNGSAFPYTNMNRNGNETSFNSMKQTFRTFPFNTTYQQYDVAGNVTQMQLPNLPVETQYTVMVTAVSIRGESSPTEHHLFTKLEKEEPAVYWSNWIYFGIPMGLLIVFLLSCNFARFYCNKRKVKMARNQYFQSMEERDAMSADWSIVPLTEEISTWKLFDDNFPKDKWEIQYENLIMGEVIGQGAFGVVRRAKIPRKKLQSSTLKYLDKNSSTSTRQKGESDLETVAVKMLKVSATREDNEQLIKEILTMQNLGFHPQIVGLIGACTRGRSLCLVLEYCPGGDLLSFIRKVRAKYWPTMGLSNVKKSGSLSSILSREDTRSSVTGTRSSQSGSGGCRIKKNVDSCGTVDSSPINYADIEGFSDYSSSPDRLVKETTGDEEGYEMSRRNPSVTEPFRSPSQISNHSEKEDDEFRPIDEKDVLSYARQIAMGMEYLEKNRIVHRDLACRNCLLMGDHKQVKISDFGLSRDIYTWNVYHQKSNGKLPIKWMSIESIFSHIFTSKSDVWSYGILLWELVTLGGTPYPGLGNAELFHLLKSGYRMERPDNSSEELYALMKKCWRTSSGARPSFTELRHHVENMMEAAEPNLYLSLMADIPSDYFRLSSKSDLLQMKPETSETSFEGREGYNSSSGSRRGSSKKFAGYHNTNSIYNKHSHASPICGLPDGKNLENAAPYTRSNSITSSVPSFSDSANPSTSLKFTLGSVPKRQNRQSHSNGESQHNKRSSLVSMDSGLPVSENGCYMDGSCTITNNIITSNTMTDESNTTNQLQSSEEKVIPFEKGDHSQTKTKSSEQINEILQDERRGENFGKLPYPFIHVNEMTIIENKTYDLTDD